MEENLANLSIIDEEEEAFKEEESVVERYYKWCLVDIQRVLDGTPWFFNNHLLILQRITNGENPVTMPLNHTEFWVQVHDLPPGLMTEAMAKQFGNFCGKFIEYDSVNLSLGISTFMRIRISLDIFVPLKWKKKVQIGNLMTVYARFKYEKLSLFCFIRGRLGHGESFCPYRLRIEASKIVYGWDLSLRAEPMQRRMAANRWLRDVDGSRRIEEILESSNNGNSFKTGNIFMRQMEGSLENQSENPNFTPLGVNQHLFHNERVQRLDWRKEILNDGEITHGPMELGFEDENDPIPLVDGKKRQRVMVGESSLLDSMAGKDSTTLSASSGAQSSRAQ
ncbi:nucleolin-like [Gossypium australe]|uniref:Nucleolin-like n=1 Tax=Gossypium australe TaxID=47621 RepID=A0A5B6V7J6_9ROSI|nr:nucleolin-like [Gossypium australe]